MPTVGETGMWRDISLMAQEARMQRLAVEKIARILESASVTEEQARSTYTHLQDKIDRQGYEPEQVEAAQKAVTDAFYLLGWTFVRPDPGD